MAAYQLHNPAPSPPLFSVPVWVPTVPKGPCPALFLARDVGRAPGKENRQVNMGPVSLLGSGLVRLRTKAQPASKSN